jgi:hypothetical protein
MMTFEERWKKFTAQYPDMLYSRAERAVCDLGYVWGLIDGMERIKLIVSADQGSGATSLPVDNEIPF